MKRSFTAILLTASLLIGTLAGIAIVPVAAQEVSAAAVTLGDGDVNGDGKINIFDLMAASSYINGQQAMSAAQQAKMDVFADGTVDIFDVMCVYNFVNGHSQTLVGEPKTPAEHYADFALETVETTQPIKAGETVEIALTVSKITDLIGLEFRVAYDSTLLSFKEAVSSKKATLSVNDSPVGVNGMTKELWMTMMSSQKYSFDQGDKIVTLRFEAVTDIAVSTAVTFKTAKAVSNSSVRDFQALTCGATNGGVFVTTPTAPSPEDIYVTYTMETVTYDRVIAADETVELDITASAVSDINGVQLNVCFDDGVWEWVSGEFVNKLSRFSQKTVNTEPLHPMTDKGEVWMTAMDMRGYSLAENTVIATITLKAKKDVRVSSEVGLCYVQASSYEGTIHGFDVNASGVNGGVTITLPTYTGPLGDYFYKENVQLKAYQLVAHNGDFYFVGDAHKLAKNKTVYLADTFVAGHTYADGTPLKAGNYDFDESGKMIIKNGPVGDYFYKNNAKLSAYQLIEFEDNYYFISDGHKLVKNVTLALAEKFVAGHTYADGSALQAGKYDFDENGKMIIKNGPVGDCFYKNNTRLNAYQLVEFEGNYYFISDGHKLVKNATLTLAEKFVAGHTYADGSAMQAGKYDFDENGKMIIKNGPVGDYFYKNNTRLNAYQLVEFEGNCYFISDAHKVAKNVTLSLSEKFVAGHTYADGSAMQAGKYAFDENGKMVIKNGPVGDYFYKNNTRLNAYQLVEFEGNYYFISDAHKLAKNVTLSLAEKFVAGHTNPDGSAMQAGKYAFDENGKMIIKNGPVGEYFYKNNTMLKAYQLAEFEGNFYFVSDAHKLAKNMTLTLSENHVAGHTYADGTPMQPGTYSFDENGKMIIKNGVVGDYFYLNNVKQTAYRVVKYEGNLYFIGDGNKVAKNKKVYLKDSYVAGVFTDEGYPLFEGYYTFDENGKLVF